MTGLLKWLRSKLSFGSKQKRLEWYHLPAYKCILSLPFESMAPGDTTRLYHTLGRMALATFPFGGPHDEREYLRLVVTGDYAEGEEIEEHTLRFKTLDGALARWIVATFPSITDLFFHQAGQANIEGLAYLISTDSVWSKQLTIVDLFIYSPEQFCAISSLLVANCLQLEKLCLFCKQKLSFPLEKSVAGPEFMLNLEPSNESKLTYFYLSSHDEINITWYILQQAMNDGNELIKYGINMTITEHTFEPLMRRVGPRLASRIIELDLQLPLQNDMTRLVSFVAKFQALTVLNFTTLMNLMETLSRLIYLPKLIILNIRLDSYEQLPQLSTQEVRMEEPFGNTLKFFILTVIFMEHNAFDYDYLLEQAFTSPVPSIELYFHECLTCNHKMEQIEQVFSIPGIPFKHSPLRRECALTSQQEDSAYKWKRVKPSTHGH